MIFFAALYSFAAFFFEINCRSHAIISKLNILILSINIQPLLIIQLSITTPTSHTPGSVQSGLLCVVRMWGGGVSGSRNSWSASDQTSSKSAPKDGFFELIFFIKTTCFVNKTYFISLRNPEFAKKINWLLGFFHKTFPGLPHFFHVREGVLKGQDSCFPR